MKQQMNSYNLNVNSNRSKSINVRAYCLLSFERGTLLTEAFVFLDAASPVQLVPAGSGLLLVLQLAAAVAALSELLVPSNAAAAAAAVLCFLAFMSASVSSMVRLSFFNSHRTEQIVHKIKCLLEKKNISSSEKFVVKII